MKTDRGARQRFGEAVRRRRGWLGISQEELAGRAGLHRTYVSDIERGARNPTLEAITCLARALQTPAHSLLAPHEPQTVEILLVEDDARDVELTLRAFQKAHVRNRVTVARDGEEALALLLDGERTLHLVLLDLRLPKVDGLEVLRRLKADPRGAAIPVVVLTGSLHDDDIEECRRLGVANYLVKPVDFQSFSRIVPDLPLSWMLLSLHAAAP